MNRILTALLRSDNIQYSIRPVRGYSDIERVNVENILNNDEITSIILINCGALVNLKEILNLEDTMRCFVFDNHRPIHLSNIYSESQIILFEDGIENEVGIPPNGDNLDGDELSSDEEDENDKDLIGELEKWDSDEEGEEEFDFDNDNINITENQDNEENNNNNNKEVDDHDDDDDDDDDPDNILDTQTQDDDELLLSQTQENDNYDADDENNNDNPAEDNNDVNHSTISDNELNNSINNNNNNNNNENDENDNNNNNNSNNEEEEEEEVENELNEYKKEYNEKKKRKMRRQQIREYYNGTYFGAPTSILLFDLSVKLSKDTNDLLWLCILGLTDHYLNKRIDTEGYFVFANYINRHVQIKNPTIQDAIRTKDGALVQNNDEGRIKFDLDYRFLLYRHWTLYDSLSNSNYVVSKLGVWKPQGKQDLHGFLAKIGISLNACKQKYEHINPKILGKIKDNIEKWGPEYKLDDPFFGVFLRSTGYTSELSACDVIEGTNALLESPFTNSSFDTNNNFNNNKENINKNNDNDNDNDKENIDNNNINDNENNDINPSPKKKSKIDNSLYLEKKEEIEWLSRWHKAYDSLLSRNKGLFFEGIHLAIGLQTNIVMEGIKLINNKSIHRLPHFRYAILEDLFDSNNKHNEKMSSQSIFSYPMTLRRLALFLIEIHHENGKWAGDNAKPLILLSEKQDTYLVIGISYNADNLNGEIIRNRFGQAFRIAVEQINAKMKHDGFDSSIIEIEKDYAIRFIESLHLTLDA